MQRKTNDAKTDNQDEQSPNYELGKDTWEQLVRRVSIPVFGGGKRFHWSWKAAFMACVEKVPATAEYKPLQLKKCLSGEALRSVESLGH